MDADDPTEALVPGDAVAEDLAESAVMSSQPGQAPALMALTLPTLHERRKPAPSAPRQGPSTSHPGSWVRVLGAGEMAPVVPLPRTRPIPDP